MHLRRLLRANLAPYRQLLALVVVFQTVQTAASLELPALNADLINQGVLVGDNAYIRRAGMTMLGFTILQVLFNVAAVWFGAKAAMSFGRDLRRDLFHQVTGFSAREVGRFGAPSLITRITNDVQQVQMLVVMICTMMVAAPLTVVIGVIMAMREDVGLSWVLASFMVIAVVVLGVLVSRMVPSFQQMQVRIDEVNRVLREQITGIRVVRAFVREPVERVRFETANRDLTDTSLRTGRLMAAMFPTVMLIINSASVAVLWVGADRVGTAPGDLQVGSLIAYLSYLIQILMAVVMATFMVSMIPRAAVAADRIAEVLDVESTVAAPVDPVSTMPDPGTVRFEGVGFHYPGADSPVLSGIDFEVRPGQTLAIIGSTGAGKTTLVNLIPRLFDPTEGTVFVGGVDATRLAPDVLWSSVGYVPQKPYLFAGTVAGNLRYGRDDATEDELWDALEIAQAADFVRSMPEQLDAPISQGGGSVSGGQRQRLSIARAVVGRPQVYVFDDSFSALDLLTDRALREALAPQTRDAAVIVVAQRVSSIIDADQILVMENGFAVGLGRHDELVEGCPTYREIVESQAAVEAGA